MGIKNTLGDLNNHLFAQLERLGDEDLKGEELLEDIAMMETALDKYVEADCDTCDKRKCRVCGCTWNNACSGGCYWVEWDLCSSCVGEEGANEDE